MDRGTYGRRRERPKQDGRARPRIKSAASSALAANAATSKATNSTARQLGELAGNRARHRRPANRPAALSLRLAPRLFGIESTSSCLLLLPSAPFPGWTGQQNRRSVAVAARRSRGGWRQRGPPEDECRAPERRRRGSRGQGQRKRSGARRRGEREREREREGGREGEVCAGTGRGGCVGVSLRYCMFSFKHFRYIIGIRKYFLRFKIVFTLVMNLNIIKIYSSLTILVSWYEWSSRMQGVLCSTDVT